MQAVIPLAEGVEEIEAVTLLDVLRRGGIQARAVAMGPARTVRGSRGIGLEADGPWDPAEAEACALLAMPGGLKATETLCGHAGLRDVIRARVAAQRWVAAICAAPRVLDAAGVLAGRAFTGYPGCMPDLEADRPDAAPVVIDPPLVTSRGPATAMALALVLVEILRGETVRAAVAKGLLWTSG